MFFVSVFMYLLVCVAKSDSVILCQTCEQMLKNAWQCLFFFSFSRVTSKYLLMQFCLAEVSRQVEKFLSFKNCHEELLTHFDGNKNCLCHTSDRWDKFYYRPYNLTVHRVK